MARRSKIGDLPAEVRRWLNATLVEGNFAGYELLEGALKERGFQISKSAIHRYGQNMERRLAAVRASTEAARQIAEAAPDDADQRSAAVISLVQTDIFNMLLLLQEAEGADPENRLKLMSRAAKSIAEISRASINVKKWQAEMQRKIDAKMAGLEGQAQSGKAGFDLETLRRVREELYGIV